jgi:hypothetical protein
VRLTRSTIITGVAVLVLVAAIPSAIREALESGRIYLFSRELLIFHQVHPGAALVIGPVLITAPYALARAAANRVTHMIGRRTSP